MKKIFLGVVLLVAALAALTGCGESESYINGVHLSEFSIVYSDEDYDYSKRAAEYIRDEVSSRTGIELTVRKDSEESDGEYEIVVGETSREISARLDADTEGVEFAILAEEKQIALEGDYFVIAAAAYYFVDTYVVEEDHSATVPMGVSVHEPIVKKAENFIVLIGDGMGPNQTLLFDYMNNNCEYSDGEELFYGYMLPYAGTARTDSLSGVTDSAAAGTALSSGIKTLNGYIGQNASGENVTSLTELALSLGMGAAVMSTESSKGATPAAFSAHTSSRNNSSDILDQQFELQYDRGAVIDCNFDLYNTRGLNHIEETVVSTLDKIDDGKGFFLMYEEAHIDKHSHSNDINKTFLALMRFNQVIARFMEYAFYNPNTFILITADHETGGLLPNSSGSLGYTTEDHTGVEVPVFAYGDGAELFDGISVENIQIPQTIAAFLGVTDFGDQSEYQYLKK